MSCYEWERGDIKLSSKAYVPFRKTMIEAWNKHEDELFVMACRAYDKIKELGKGKRNFDYRAALNGLNFNESWDDSYRNFDYRAALNGLNFNESWDDSYRISWLIFGTDGKNNKPVRPKKKDLQKKPVSKACVLHFGDAAIGFSDQRKVVVWHVDENNHACEHAREHPLAQLFFRELSKVEWTRGTGGQIVGNDEYNRESYSDGGGGNYVTADYHKKTKAELEQERRSRSYSYGSRW